LFTRAAAFPTNVWSPVAVTTMNAVPRLTVEEAKSGITGESLAVDKHHGDKVFASSTVKRGTAFMVVTPVAVTTMNAVPRLTVEEANTLSPWCLSTASDSPAW
jgi:hypothetical protein